MSNSRPITKPTAFGLARVRWQPLARAAFADVLLALGFGLVLLLGTAWSYRQPFAYTMPIEENDGLYRDGLGEPEASATGWQRWTGSYALVRLPGIGRSSQRIALEFHNPQTATPRTLAISGGAQALGRVALREGWQRVLINVPPSAISAASGNLDLVLRVEPPLQASGRELGVALRALRLQSLSAATAPGDVRWALALATLLIVVPLRVLRVPRRWIALGVGALLVVTIALLASARIAVLLALPPITLALTLALLAVPVLWWWIRAQFRTNRRWAGAVAVVALALFVVRLSGLQHPQFVLIDHVLRVHQIQAIARGGREQVQAELSRQYEWGADVAVPYSLLSYDLFVPLVDVLSRDQLLLAVEATTVALDASVLILLWSIARRSGLSARTSWWVAALYAIMPVGYLYHHDGSYPTIIGLWMVVVTLWLLTLLVGTEAHRSRINDRASAVRTYVLFGLSVGAIALSILMYVTQLAFVPALLGLAVLSAWLLGAGPIRRRANWIALATATGFGIALLGYYGGQIPELVTRTIPRYVATLSQGGSVGRDAALLPGPLLGNTWQQLWGHYRVVGVGLAAVGVALALRDRTRWLTHLVVAYGIFLILTATADLRFGLWNKHMYFALPGVCLAAAPLLGAFQRRGRAGNALVLALFGFLLWTSIEAWLLRVIWYVWSLQTI